eukprot:19119-Heterococcus_DN1.PRE.1
MVVAAIYTYNNKVIYTYNNVKRKHAAIVILSAEMYKSSVILNAADWRQFLMTVEDRCVSCVEAQLSLSDIQSCVEHMQTHNKQ